MSASHSPTVPRPKEKVRQRLAKQAVPLSKVPQIKKPQNLINASASHPKLGGTLGRRGTQEEGRAREERPIEGARPGEREGIKSPDAFDVSRLTLP